MESILPKTLEQARLLSSLTYFTGKACVNGHISERRVTGGKCIECSAESSKKHWAENKSCPERKAKRAKYNSENKKTINEYVKSYRSENKEQVRARDRAYRKRNIDARRCLEKKWQKENVELIKEINKVASTLYRKNNPEKRKAAVQNCMANRKMAEGRYVAADVIRILKGQKMKCAACSVCLKKGYHMDHIFPLSKGGTNWPDNLQALCAACNLSKSAKDPYVWASENGRLF